MSEVALTLTDADDGLRERWIPSAASTGSHRNAASVAWSDSPAVGSPQPKARSSTCPHDFLAGADYTLGGMAAELDLPPGRSRLG